MIGAITSPRTNGKWIRFENQRFIRPYPPQGDHVNASE